MPVMSMQRMSALVAAPGAALLASSSVAKAEAPLSYLSTYGLHADAATPLLWGMLIISVAVVAIVVALLFLAIFRARPRPLEASAGTVGVRVSAGLSWITVGAGISTVVLFGVTIWTVASIAAVAHLKPNQSGLRLEVIGHQWWWEVRYIDDDPSRSFTTANEIHIPVGRRMHVTLRGTDVIHSFWVPALAGKTDVIPGLTNITWLEAEYPGTYWGQCTEYCGQQHAHMLVKVIASSPDQFTAWWDHQLKSSASESEGSPADEDTFVAKCGVCHSVRGTRAGGVLGPDLSHLMTRTTIAAGTLPNTPGYLSAWIADPQHIKPGALMPQLGLSGPEVVRIRRFLTTLE